MDKLLRCTIILGLAACPVCCAGFVNFQVGDKTVHIGAAPENVPGMRLPAEDFSTSSSKNVDHARARSESPLGNYLDARMKDLLDPFTVAAGLGIGLHADIEVTMLLHPAIGLGFSELIGWDGSRPYVADFIMGMPLTNLAGFEEGVVGALQGYCRTPIFGESYPRPEGKLPGLWSSPIPILLTRSNDRYGPLRSDSAQGYPPLRWADLEAGASVLALGFRIGVSPGELLDLFGGWFGWDPADDDGLSFRERDRWMPRAKVATE